VVIKDNEIKGYLNGKRYLINEIVLKIQIKIYLRHRIVNKKFDKSKQIYYNPFIGRSRKN